MAAVIFIGLTEKNSKLELSYLMGNREFLVYLDPEKRQNRYRHYHAWEGKRIMAFCIQYEAP